MNESQLGLFYGLSFLCVALAFAFAAYLYLWVKKQKTENAKIQEVSLLIKQGANTFMRREYLVLAKFAGVAAIVILVLLPSPIWTGGFVDNISMAIAYLCGTALSAIAGKIGILVATLSNGRTAEAAQKGIKPAFLIGFRGGAVMGLLVVGCSLLGVAAVLLVTGDSSILLGFSFGASSLALFAKAGGGIFTKTADVSADLTGKVELGKLILNALLTFEPVFFERGRMLEQRVIEDIHVQGSAEQLRQIVDILLDNAQKYSRESGKTWVSLQKNGKKRCLLTVENEGEPLSPQEARDIFKRFYRADKARSRTGSFGLGLSIAERIAMQHHGKIWAEGRDGVNCFFVELPCL
mgnify:CR=1 FL=1